MHQKERKDDTGVGMAPKDRGALRLTVAGLVESRFLQLNLNG